MYVFTPESIWFYCRHVYIRQERQCTYNVTLRRFLATIVAVEKQ